MGLTVTLNNTLSGMKVAQSALEVVSQNVSQSGTPGYHRRAVSVIDTMGANSSFAREGTLTRAFDQSLQQHYTRANSDAGFSSVQATFLDRLQTLIGKPGSPGSLDQSFNDFQSAMSTLATSPDNFASRSQAVQQAQVMATTLNTMTTNVQGLRQEIESKIATSVDDLNAKLDSLEKINGRLADSGMDTGSRATLLDQRDRLVNDLSSQLDLRVTYRPDDSVALSTRSGVGILDGPASQFSFESAGALSATSQFSTDDTKSGVGKLVLNTPSGLQIDLVKENVLRSGELAGLVDLRDNALVQAQGQLDDVAASIAKAFSTETTDGTPVTSGAATGYDLDIGSIRNGNEFDLTYSQNGIQKNVRVLRVDDATKLPLDYTDANGARVIGLDFSAGAASVANQLQNRLPGLRVTSPGGTTIRVLDDGATGTTDVSSLQSLATVTGPQNGQLGLSLFTDGNDTDFTDSLDGDGQRLGFAGRIAVNPAVLNDSALMVQYSPGSSLGDASRVNQLIDNLNTMRFSGGVTGSNEQSGYRLAGTISDLINQTINYQGNAAESAISDSDTQQLTLDSLGTQLDAENGVNIDDEMARLMQLQNAYAANARVMSTVQDLLDALMNA